MEDGADELDLLLHPLRQIFDLVGSPLAKLETLEPRRGALLRLARTDAADGAQIDQVLEHLHLFVESALFG